MARCWQVYNGIGDPLLLSSYAKAFTVPTGISGGLVCAVYAPSCGPTPGILSIRIKGYIADLQLTLVAQPGGGTTVYKKYVYGKN